jgi:hypothetical protein
MVRIAQNLAMAAHVREHPREAHAMKKLFVDPFDLPTLSHLPPILDRKSFVPRSTLPTTRSRKEQDERNLCSLVARSWLLLILEILSGLSRSFNLRPELASLLDSVNRILIVHGDDTNLVGLALRIYMLASSRFRRLFAANGFELVVPVIFRVFVEARGNEGIRSACRYAWQRFYRAHEESFVVQALSIISPMLGVELEEGRSAMVEGSWELFEALRMDKRDGEDVAGIRGENEREERTSHYRSFVHQSLTLFIPRRVTHLPRQQRPRPLPPELHSLDSLDTPLHPRLDQVILDREPCQALRHHHRLRSHLVEVSRLPAPPRRVGPFVQPSGRYDASSLEGRSRGSRISLREGEQRKDEEGSESARHRR